MPVLEDVNMNMNSNVGSGVPYPQSGNSRAAPPVYTPFAVGEQQNPVDIAKRMYRSIEHMPGPQKKEIVMRLIAIHNASTTLNDQISLPEQDDFKAQYPKLNQWIENKLNFLEYEQIAAFAFVSGHFSEFKQAKYSFPTNTDKMRCEFFRNYFQKEGCGQGVQKLDSMRDCSILYAAGLEKLDRAMSAFDVEPIEEASEQSAESLFDYPLVYKIIGRKLNSTSRDLSFIFGEYELFDQVKHEYPNKSEIQVMATLHFLACTGIKTDDLIKALKDCGRVDLGNKLERALQVGRS